MAKRKPVLTKGVELVITQEIIDRAVRADSTACVIADALKVAVDGGVRPLVDLQSTSITVPAKGLRYHWLTPRSAQALLINFDQGAALTPGTIRLREGWTTPIRKQSGPQRNRSRSERKRELEEMEAAGTLGPNEARALATIRATDARNARKAEEKADRNRWAGRPPLASLSNSNGRRYGLRLTRLTQHGEALIAESAPARSVVDLSPDVQAQEI